MKFRISIVLSILVFCVAVGWAKPKLYVQMANSQMKRNPQSWMIDFAKTLRWDYCQGLELQAFYKVWEKTKDSRYLDYMKSYTDTIIDSSGKIIVYKKYEYNIDKVNPGKFLFLLYDATGETKLKNATDSLYDQLKTHPRTTDGGFWHKKVYPHQMWLDGLYMGTPFLAEYAFRNNLPAVFDDVTHQILTMAKHSYDPKTGLYFHGWDESRKQRWSNPQTGTSPNFWSRSIGWYMMAMVDALDFIPATHPDRQKVLDIFNQLTNSLLKFRDPATGMWFQVTDRVGAKGNYIESSGSAMYIYSIVKGAQRGYLPESYLKTGKKLYKQFVNAFIIRNADGTISVTNCCAVAGLGGDKNYRDGSYEYYLSEPVRHNDPKTVAPFMMVSVLLNK
jgi:unsaturated rhamnogalacturonyl hydrolase